MVEGGSEGKVIGGSDGRVSEDMNDEVHGKQGGGWGGGGWRVRGTGMETKGKVVSWKLIIGN